VIEWLAALKFLPDMLPRTLRALKGGCKRLSFRWQERHPPFDRNAAFKIAFSVLGGQIGECAAFRNIDSNRPLIAAVKTGEYGTKEVHLLEKFGLSFQTVWSIAKINKLDGFLVIDVDGDGNKEIVFTEDIIGTAAETATLYIYSHSRGQTARVIQQWVWSDATRAPNVPVVSIKVEPTSADDQRFVEHVEKYSIDSGFLERTEELDLDRSDLAAARWHQDNGDPKWGPIKLRFYPGRPPCNSSVSRQLSGGGGGMDCIL
jgi:hypothetical protein